MLSKWLLITAGLLVLVLTVAVWLAQRTWRKTTQALRERLIASATAAATVRYSEAEIDGLPTPVARYFRAVLKDGQPVVERARVSWGGRFNVGKPGANKWTPFTAEQDFVPGAPGFVWNARIAMGLGMHTLVRDAFVDATGSMQAKILGLVTLADSHGTEALALAALQRYLGEAAWFPTALLPSQGVRWEPIDGARARASINSGAVTASLEFRFGADGLIETVFAPRRWYDDGPNPPAPHPWQARNLRYGKLNGMLVPIDSTVEWLFPAGPHAYWRGQPIAIEYHYAAE